MPVFNPPTVDEAPMGFGPLFRRYKFTRGISVAKVSGHFTNKRFPSLLDLDGLTDGISYFLGGHVYVISADVAAQLIADGYGAYITDSGSDLYLDLYLEAY